jgi:hypothetical protein
MDATFSQTNDQSDDGRDRPLREPDERRFDRERGNTAYAATELIPSSLDRKHDAPFNVNSKDYMEVPQETEEWCHRFARFVTNASNLTARGEHAQAVACFAMLYELLEAADSGEEIIFAEEAGSWMIPTDETFPFLLAPDQGRRGHPITFPICCSPSPLRFSVLGFPSR